MAQVRIDYSVIRLKPTLEEALKVFIPSISDRTLNQHNQILLRPSEAYLQVTNIDGGMNVLDKVEIVDGCDTLLADITDNTALASFFDDDGNIQMAWEVAYLPVDYQFKPVHLKFSNTFTEESWWSNPILITESGDQYTRFDYLYYGKSPETGIDFTNEIIAGKYLSVGIRAFFADTNARAESKGYDQLSTGQQVTSKVQTYREYTFRSQYLNTFLELQFPSVLSADVLYIGWNQDLPYSYRCSNKPALKSDKAIGQTNMKPSEFVANLDLGEKRMWSLQIDPLLLITKVPFGLTSQGTWTGADASTFTGTFNKNVSLGTGTFRVYNAATDALIRTYNPADITVAGNSFTIPSEDILPDGSYYNKISTGLFRNSSQPLEQYFGINDKTTWAFTLISALGYDKDYYTTGKYLTD